MRLWLLPLYFYSPALSVFARCTNHLGLAQKNNTVLYFAILALIGAAAGYLSGLMGLGGGIIIIPALMYFLGFSQQTAQGTTLGLMVLPIGALAAMEYYKAGQIDLKAVGIMTITFVAASYFGSKMATSIEPQTLRKLFAVTLIFIAFKMFYQK